MAKNRIDISLALENKPQKSSNFKTKELQSPLK